MVSDGEVLLQKIAHAIYRDFFSAVKKENFFIKILIVLIFFAQNIDCGTC